VPCFWLKDGRKGHEPMNAEARKILEARKDKEKDSL
jgi:hypothetical protein